MIYVPPRLCCSKIEQRSCISCHKCTRHLICTHWVACNDYKKNRRAKFKIYVCLDCKAEYSPCRECTKQTEDAPCSKKTENAPCTGYYLWEENKTPKKAKFSFKCLKCNKRYLRCDYCKVLSRLSTHFWKSICGDCCSRLYTRTLEAERRYIQ